jgi:hypothetical protein
MKSELNQKLEQLHFEAEIEHLLREKDQSFQTWTELEKFSKRILSFRFWGFQLEVRKCLSQ